MRLVADAMLGSLARWLRTLGYDTLYDPSLSDHELVRLARQEGRVLLTRDTELVRRRNLNVLFVESGDWKAQIKQVLKTLRLPTSQPFTRCLECNELLVPISRSEAWGLVPPYVFANRDSFSLCPKCNKVFWPGTHRQHMEQTIRELWSGKGDDAGAR